MSLSFLDVSTYDSYLGHGSFGIVLKARENEGPESEQSSSSQKATAIKFLFLHNNKDDYTEILREFNNAKDLQGHENIVNILNSQGKSFNSDELKTMLQIIPITQQRLSQADFYINAAIWNGGSMDTICIQMELCGQSLSSWLTAIQHYEHDTILQLKQIAIVQNLISGLKYLHDHKIIHRDLKPGNIMFSSPSDKDDKYPLPVKIGDFGISRKIHSDETQTCELGSLTPNYMAPEVRSGEDYSYQADLYSLGLIIWEVTALIHPKNKSNLFHQLTLDKNEKLVQSHDLITGAKQLILNLTRIKVEKRIQNIDQVIEIVKSWDNIVYPKKEMTPKNGQELELCLKYAPAGCVIILTTVEYVGKFILNQNNVQITGKVSCNGSTVFKSSKELEPCLTLNGKSCAISNFRVETAVNIGILLNGSNNTVEDVIFAGSGERNTCLVIHGDKNKIDNLTMYMSACGIDVTGSKNKLNKITMNTVNVGMKLCEPGKSNNVSNLSCRNIKVVGIQVLGPDNRLSGVVLIKGQEFKGCKGLWLQDKAKRSIVEHLTCTGFSRESTDWAVDMEGCDHSSVKNSKCGPLSMSGIKDVSLSNVNGGELIQIDSLTNNLNMTTCIAKKFELSPQTEMITITKCRFDNNQPNK